VQTLALDTHPKTAPNMVADLAKVGPCKSEERDPSYHTHLVCLDISTRADDVSQIHMLPKTFIYIQYQKPQV
jgi:hypothetical protein